MVKVWYVFEGQEPTSGGPNHVLTIGDCSRKLGLSNDHLIPEHRLSGPFCTPRLGSPDDKLAPFKEPRHVVVEIEVSEATAEGWQPGYYLLPLTPKEASTRLGQS